MDDIDLPFDINDPDFASALSAGDQAFLGGQQTPTPKSRGRKKKSKASPDKTPQTPRSGLCVLVQRSDKCDPVVSRAIDKRYAAQIAASAPPIQTS